MAEVVDVVSRHMQRHSNCNALSHPTDSPLGGEAAAGEHKSEAKKDPSRKRGITGNFVAMYQPSSVSKILASERGGEEVAVAVG